MLSFTMHYNGPHSQFTARVSTPPIPAVDPTTDRTAAVDSILKQFHLPDVFECKSRLQLLLAENDTALQNNTVNAIREAIGAMNAILQFRRDLIESAMITPTAYAKDMPSVATTTVHGIPLVIDDTMTTDSLIRLVAGDRWIV